MRKAIWHKILRRYTSLSMGVLFSLITHAQVRTVPAAYISVKPVNFVRTWTALVPDTSAADIAITVPATNYSITTQYMDGLGRPIQTVTRQGGVSANSTAVDLVEAVVYDPFGREQVKYLPFSSNVATAGDAINDGSFKLDAFQQQAAFSAAQYPGETYYYSQSDLEASPLNRVFTSYSPGNSWVGSNRGVGFQYQLNSAADSVRIWNIDSTAGSKPVNAGIYPDGKLSRNVTTDEQNHQIIEYKDKEARTILKKVQQAATPGTGHIGWVCTYYVYDALERLRFVIQPKAVEIINNTTVNWGISQTVADELCFRYEYDQRGRMIIKKVPGAGETWMVYNQRDWLVMTQDANTRALHNWVYYTYDGLNRQITSGQILNEFNYANLAYHLGQANSTSANYPTLANFTTTELSQTYYDDYDWVTAIGGSLSASLNTSNTSNSSYFFTTYNTTPSYAVAINQYTNAKSLSTGMRSKVIGTAQDIYSIPFYDDHGRVVQVESTNYTNGLDLETTQYDFSGKPLRKLLTHQKNGTNAQGHIVLTKYTYDAASRPTSIRKVMDGQEARIDSLFYNGLCQVRAKYLGNNIDSLVYDYNIRGWITGINKKYITGTGVNYFGTELGYNNSASGITTYSTPQFNGNIAGTVWKSAGDGINRKYDFLYDNVNRLTTANFTQYNGSTFAPSTTIDFGVPKISYDANGNILTMIQRGFKIGGSSPIDSLIYGYFSNSNRLRYVYDLANDTASKLGDFHYSNTKDTVNTPDYNYDVNGNISNDKNKGIRLIHYNYLNVPDTISMTKADGSSKGRIVFKYDAAGNKLAKIVIDSSVTPVRTITTLYIQGFQYQNDTIQFVGHEEGKTRYFWQHYLNGDSSFRKQFDYYEKDHLGNTRIVLTEQKDTTQYIATMEGAYRTKENALFYNIPQTAYSRVTAGYPVDISTTNPNDSVIMLNGNAGHIQGPAIILKVMAGDTIDVGAKSYYTSQTGTGTNASITDALNALANGIVGVTAGAKGTISQLNTTGSPLYAALNSFITNNNPNPPSKPKAYLNWMFMDNQFKYDPVKSGSIPVGNFTAGTLGTPAQPGIVAGKSGYLYVWVSNETTGWPVFFDNMSVKVRSGPILEETHYYPFGLTMAGISDKALKNSYTTNKHKYNGKEMQNQELSDGTGLEVNDYGARLQDPQLGVWHSIDPKADQMRRYSPYNFAFDNPMRFVDPDGMGPTDIVYFNAKGHETDRIKSNTVFETYVEVKSPFMCGGSVWVQAKMPNVILNKGKEITSGSRYQQNDYQIAASTFIFNETKNSGNLQLVTDNGNKIPQSAIAQIPDLDPTLVKAVSIQESDAGAKTTDVMQANTQVSDNEDWDKFKAAYGLVRGKQPNIETSINTGIVILATKGFRGGITYDTKTGAQTWTFKGWNSAADSYNGNGAKKHGQDYKKSVKEMYEESKTPYATDYND